jgi:hypothetical protein
MNKYYIWIPRPQKPLYVKYERDLRAPYYCKKPQRNLFNFLIIEYNSSLSRIMPTCGVVKYSSRKDLLNDIWLGPLRATGSGQGRGRVGPEDNVEHIKFLVLTRSFQLYMSRVDMATGSARAGNPSFYPKSFCFH